MKKFAKRLSLLATTVLALMLAVCGLVSCGETAKKAEVSDVYLTKGSFTELGSEYAIEFNASVSVILYSDNTYELIDKSDMYMGIYNHSPVSFTTTVLYGTYTLITSGDADDTSATLELAAPTQIVYVNHTNGAGVMYNTADESTFEGAEITASALLAKGSALTLMIDTSSKSISSGVTAGAVISLL